MSVLLTGKSYFTLKIYCLLTLVTIKWYELMRQEREDQPLDQDQAPLSRCLQSRC